MSPIEAQVCYSQARVKRKEKGNKKMKESNNVMDEISKREIKIKR